MDKIYNMLDSEGKKNFNEYFKDHKYDPNKNMDYYTIFNGSFSIPDDGDFNSILNAEKQRFNPIIEDGAFSCPNCKSKKVTTRQVQMRSGDEGANTLLTCHNCGRQWIR